MLMVPLVRWQCLSLHVTGVWELASHVSVGLARALSRKGSRSEDLAHDPGNQNCSDVPSSGGGGLGGRGAAPGRKLYWARGCRRNWLGSGVSGVRSRGAPSQPAEWGPSLQSQGDQGEGSLGWRCRDSAGSCVTWHHSRVMSSTLRRGAITHSARLWPSSCSRGVHGAGSRVPVTVGPRGNSGAIARTVMIGQHPGSQHLVQGLSSKGWAV